MRIALLATGSHVCRRASTGRFACGAVAQARAARSMGTQRRMWRGLRPDAGGECSRQGLLQLGLSLVTGGGAKARIRAAAAHKTGHVAAKRTRCFCRSARFSGIAALSASRRTGYPAWPGAYACTQAARVLRMVGTARGRTQRTQHDTLWFPGAMYRRQRPYLVA